MPSTNVRYVDVDAEVGGDGTTNALSGANCAYRSLSIWEAARQADLPTGDIIEQCICESSHANHTADTTATTIDGWTTDATRYIEIKTSTGARHDGTWNTAKYRLVLAASGHCILAVENDVRIEGLQLAPYGTATLNRWAFVSTATGSVTYRISKCLITPAAGSAQYDGGIKFATGPTGGSAYIWDTVIYGFINNAAAHGIHIEDVDVSAYLYNLTISSCGRGVKNAGTVTLKNCLFNACTVDAIGTITDTYCATTNDNTKGLTAAGTGNRFSITAHFLGAADFHLDSTFTDAIDYGTADPGSGLFSDDIDGVTRSGTWDIGADEYVAAGGLSIPVAMHYMRMRGTR